ncbi:dienelactone hydrolase family protein [Thiorhodococcus mannitoliphagus]|uniref:Dienelactone hydrolase family protein n=1 Tax=Thiorhodococcus mannitoliphagus TaxID=329406 RepID=A0A6P1E2W7_9GAMM|nr:dienelactone hydrolase family protein [Thiorhodococcus mannitoliphagus]NEX22832.1 dienelactone hydrolase family protein [Thiorhodococcus mannitoliphagus]
MRKLIGLLALLVIGTSAQAEIQSKAISYNDEGTALTGHLYWDDATKEKRPGVLVVHEWWGLNDYAKKRARMLAELGYAAFAADMYGGNQVTKDPNQAREWMQAVTVDPELWRLRAGAALAQLKASDLVIPEKTAAIGYCFGGGTVLQMAYGDADVRGVVSFHGSLPAAPEEAQGKIGPKILVLHGQADSFVAPDVAANFRSKLEAAGANWEMDIYGGVRHSFTNPDVGEYGIENLKYDAQADARSWTRMQSFLDELFQD